jgi:hypothetical protein
MAHKLKRPPLPSNPKATLEVHPGQILSEQPSLEALAEQYLDDATPTQPSIPIPFIVRDSAVYARVDQEVPMDGLSYDEGMLLSVVDGRRDVDVIGSISGIEVDEVQRVLDGLERRSLLVRRS